MRHVGGCDGSLHAEAPSRPESPRTASSSRSEICPRANARNAPSASTALYDDVSVGVIVDDAPPNWCAWKTSSSFSPVSARFAPTYAMYVSSPLDVSVDVYSAVMPPKT
eukprot:Amastigsp_a177760_17.p4 type:complete len:109 gc:universal Amastigsp_a177760_17:1451-1125(-)